MIAGCLQPADSSGRLSSKASGVQRHQLTLVLQILMTPLLEWQIEDIFASSLQPEKIAQPVSRQKALNNKSFIKPLKAFAGAFTRHTIHVELGQTAHYTSQSRHPGPSSAFSEALPTLLSADVKCDGLRSS